MPSTLIERASFPRTGSSGLLVSDATAVSSVTCKDVPEGIVTSLNCGLGGGGGAAGVAGAEAAADEAAGDEAAGVEAAGVEADGDDAAAAPDTGLPYVAGDDDGAAAGAADADDSGVEAASAAAAGTAGSPADAAGAAAAGAAFASAAGGACDVHAVASMPVSTMDATCFAITISFEITIPTLSAELEPGFNQPSRRA